MSTCEVELEPGTLYDLYSKSLLYATRGDVEVGEKRTGTLRRKIDMHEIRRVSRYTKKYFPYLPTINHEAFVFSFTQNPLRLFLV